MGKGLNAMSWNSSQVIQSRSLINYSYATIEITQSRLDKGLIAIPMSLAAWFPDYNTTVQVYLDNSPVLYTKTYSSYKSATRECRIGGMAEWFKENRIHSGDEIVIQLVDKERFIYRLIPERTFILKTKELQARFDESEDEADASDKIISLAEWTDLDEQKVMLNEYYRLTNTMPIEERRYASKYSNQVREGVPCNLRVLLRDIYKGHCQVCDFWFLKRDNTPYFEIHHINASQGNNPKNLLLVCANCHRQFEFAGVQHEFTNEGWLAKVSFNRKIYSVNQILVKTRLGDYVKKSFI